MLREDIRWIRSARDVEQLNDSVPSELLQQPDSPRNVREAFQRRAVGRDEHGDSVVAPHWHNIVAEHAEANEAQDACEMQELRGGDRRGKQLRCRRVYRCGVLTTRDRVELAMCQLYDIS